MSSEQFSSRRHWLPIAAVALLALAGCRQDMHDQPKIEPLEASQLFADGRASRDLIPGTVPRGQLRDDRVFYTGIDEAGEFVDALPFAIDPVVLARGQNRFEVFCTPCHDRSGSGRGMIVRRGFKQPTSFHVDRLRQAPHGYYYDVMTKGFGQMSSYASQIAPADRWAIVAYIRALQLSQGFPATELTRDERQLLDHAAAAAAEPSEGAH